MGELPSFMQNKGPKLLKERRGRGGGGGNGHLKDEGQNPGGAGGEGEQAGRSQVSPAGALEIQAGKRKLT